MLETWYLFAFRLYGDEALRGAARIRQANAVLITALQRCAFAKQNASMAVPDQSRYAPTWRQIATLTSVLEYLQQLDHFSVMSREMLSSCLGNRHSGTLAIRPICSAAFAQCSLPLRTFAEPAHLLLSIFLSVVLTMF